MGIGFFALNEISIPFGTPEPNPWATMADMNNLEFKSNRSSYLESSSQVVGYYRGYHLKLEFQENRYFDQTSLTLLVGDPSNNSFAQANKVTTKRSITTEDIINLLAPNGLSEKLKQAQLRRQAKSAKQAGYLAAGSTLLKAGVGLAETGALQAIGSKVKGAFKSGGKT